MYQAALKKLVLNILVYHLNILLRRESQLKSILVSHCCTSFHWNETRQFWI